MWATGILAMLTWNFNHDRGLTRSAFRAIMVVRVEKVLSRLEAFFGELSFLLA